MAFVMVFQGSRAFADKRKLNNECNCYEGPSWTKIGYSAFVHFFHSRCEITDFCPRQTFIHCRICGVERLTIQRLAGTKVILEKIVKLFFIGSALFLRYSLDKYSTMIYNNQA